MDAHAHRAMLAAQLDMARQLIEHLEPDGLMHLRTFLRHEDTVRTCLGTALVDVRADLLDATCRLLAGRGVGSVEGFAALGDVITAAPDTPAALLFDDGRGEVHA